MSDLDRRMAQVLDDAVPDPPRALNPEAIRAGQLADGHRPLRTVLAVVAAVIVVGAIVAVVVATRGPDRKPLAAGPHTSAAPAPQGNSPRAVTIRVLDRLLAAAPRLPGSIPRASAPAAVLRDGVSRPSSPNLVRRVTWFVAEGGMDDALAYFAAHVPSAFRPDGEDTYTDHSVTKVRSASYAAAGVWQRPRIYTSVEVSIAVTPIGDKVGVGIYADAIWLPPRSAGSYVPRDVTAVRVRIERPGFAPTVRRELGKEGARHLAAIVNRLRVLNPVGVTSCPMMQGRKDQLVFNDPGRTTVKVAVDGCTRVGVSRYGHEKDGLETRVGRTDINLAILAAVGLPRDYGSR